MAKKQTGAKLQKNLSKIANAAVKKTSPRAIKPLKDVIKVEIEPRTCKECSKSFESKFSGSLYCPECAVIKKKERRKSSQKRRKANRKDELNDLRTLKADIIKALEGKDALIKIKALVKG